MSGGEEEQPPRSTPRPWWSAICGAGIFAALASCAAWGAFVRAYPDYAVGDFLGFWGLVIGLFGSAVSIIGFSFGLAQLRRTQTASEAAAATAAHIQKSYASFDILQLLSHAKEVARQAADHLNGSRYAEMALCYRELQTSLWRMGSTKGVLLPKRSDDLKDLAGKAREAYSMLTAKARDPDVELDAGAFERWLQVMDNILTEVDLELRSEAHGR